jgi:hypothetical protein
MVEAILLRQIPRPFASIALVATLLISGVGVTVPPTAARADDCLTAPNSPAPQGSHWYYRLDRATQRKCWYVRAPGQPALQAAASAATGPATPLRSTPAPSGRTPLAARAPMSLKSGDTTPPSQHVSAPPSPHVIISAVKPIPAPVSGGTTNKTVPQSAQEENTASTQEVSAPQTSTVPETSPQAATSPAVTWPRTQVAVAADKPPEPIAVATDARADPAPAVAKGTARRTEPSNNGGMPMIIFPVLALGLAGVGILSRVVIKNAAARRARTIIDHPEPDGVDDQRQRERCDDQLRLLVSAVSDPGPLRNDDGAFQITQEISKRGDKLVQLRRDIDGMLQSLASTHDGPLPRRTAAC